MNTLIPFSDSQLPNHGDWSSFVNQICALVHGKRIIERQAEIVKLNAAQRAAGINALTQIALTVKDDQTRLQMFRDIWLLVANN